MLSSAQWVSAVLTFARGAVPIFADVLTFPRTVQKPKLEQKWFLRSNVRCCVSATKRPLGKKVMFVCEENTYPRTENSVHTDTQIARRTTNISKPLCNSN